MIREDDVLILPFLKNRIGRGSMQRLVVALFVALDVAARCTAGTGATPAAFYLGLCRLRGVLFPPAPHDHAAGGPFYFATTKIRIGRGAVAATTAAGGPFYLLARWRYIDSRFQAQTCESMQQRGQIRGNPCIDS